jgi:hypothetical protein
MTIIQSMGFAKTHCRFFAACSSACSPAPSLHAPAGGAVSSTKARSGCGVLHPDSRLGSKGFKLEKIIMLRATRHAAHAAPAPPAPHSGFGWRAALAVLVTANAMLLAATVYSAATPDPANPDSWERLPERFESTGGGGWMIEEYRPVVSGQSCVTDFVAVAPDGTQRFANTVSFSATPHLGGTMCTNGEWRARDGSGSGTTPIRLFIKDGVVRRAP